MTAAGPRPMHISGPAATVLKREEGVKTGYDSVPAAFS